MTAEEAIREAAANGVCKIQHNVFLFSTKEAKGHIQFDDMGKPFQLVLDALHWSDIHPVSGVKDKRLLEICGG